MPVRLVTWNVNSIRLRLNGLAQLVQALRPDVLCLQETKVADGQFPAGALTELGYDHLAIAGMKSYNGVAIASRFPLTEVRTLNWCDREDCRHLVARTDGVDVHCLYVPSGGDVPDTELNDKFAHKLDFLDALGRWFARSGGPGQPVALLGDFNVAPLPTDVWSHKEMLNVVSHTPIEVARLTALQASVAWVDAVRHFISPSQQLYTWWSYRAKDWAASDRGRRLDHVWVTPGLAGRLTGAMVVREARGWTQPSDHVPVMVDLA
jgi:exodeoxyribonuclease-3